MYLKADAAVVPPGSYDVYLTVEYFDDGAQAARVQYDKAPPDRRKLRPPPNTWPLRCASSA